MRAAPLGGVLASLATGCLLRPPAPSTTGDAGGDGGRSRDASGDGAFATGACASGALTLFDDFSTNGSTCAPNVTPNGLGVDVARSGGDLVFTPQGVNVYSRCTYDPFPTSGATIVGAVGQIASTLAGNGDTTYMELFVGGNSVAIHVDVDAGGAKLKFYDSGATATAGVVSATPTWWRIMLDTPTHVTAAYSTDGTMWTPLGSSIVTAGATVLRIGVFSASGQASPTAEFDALYSCL